ncbi:unnamed protein product [Spirodela intermedia]|uniref:Uncharacterized protein n=1 Tax=Spirodela intermedia TaxID=51605 RepID=A0A7I8IFK1_SPIIN|nr:unnamed protein product [Spirodela intermedia]CAA6656590.1 unnamed protein product [Spirodela intermedia]
MGRRVVSGGCHPAERKNNDFAALRQLWGTCQGASSSGPRNKRRLFIASTRVYDHSLPHSRLATGEWHTRASIGPSCSSLCSRLLLDCASDPLAGSAGQWVPPICYIFIFISFS